MDSPSKELVRNSSESASSVASVVVANAKTQSIVNGVATTEPSPTSAESVLVKIRELGIDFFTEDFEGCTLASTLCLSCETTTTQEEIMLDLSVPITENMETQQLDDSFIQVSAVYLPLCFILKKKKLIFFSIFHRICVSHGNDFRATINSVVKNVQVTQKRFGKYRIQNCLVYWSYN